MLYDQKRWGRHPKPNSDHSSVPWMIQGIMIVGGISLIGNYYQFPIMHIADAATVTVPLWGMVVSIGSRQRIRMRFIPMMISAVLFGIIVVVGTCFFHGQFAIVHICAGVVSFFASVVFDAEINGNLFWGFFPKS